MERNIDRMEDSESNDHCNPHTNSIIERISNDQLPSTINKDTGMCNHFAIRAYVAEIRKKDWKICWPFCSSGERKEPHDQADFRCCQNCLSTSDASDDTADISVMPNLSEDKICAGNVGVASLEYMPLIDHLVRKEKLSSIVSNSEIRHDVFASGETENGLIKTVDEVISQPNSCVMKDVQCLNEENTTRDAGTPNLKFGGGSGILDGNDGEFGNRNFRLLSFFSTESHDKDEHVKSVPEIAKMCEKGKESITYAQLPESDSTENESLDSQASYIRTLSTKTLKCKKPQKVRWLSDILKREASGASCDLGRSNGTADSDEFNTGVTNNDAADDSDDLTLDTLFRSQKAVQSDIAKTPQCRKKRKRLQIEDLGPSQSSWSKSNSVSEDLQCHKSHKENNSIKSIIGSFASVSIASSRDVDLVDQAKKSHQNSSIQSRNSSSMTLQANSCPNLQLSNIDLESNEHGARTGDLQCQLAEDSYTGFNPSLKPYVERSSCVQRSTFCEKETSDKGSLMPPHESVPAKERAIGKNVIAGLFTPVSTMDSDVACHLKSKNATLKRQKDFSFPCNYENNIVAQARSEVTENPISERANKACDLDPLDDIPMEIVKLLAENRRERRLLEAETAYHDTICLSKSANGVKSAHKVQSTQAYDNVKTRELWQNTFQVQEKSIGAEGSTCAETCLRIVCPLQGRDRQNVGFPTVAHRPTKINSTKFATSPQKQSRNDEADKYKKSTEKPCACVQKKITKSPKLIAPLNMCGNESMPALQLLRLMDSGVNSRTSWNSSKDFEVANYPLNNHCEFLRPFSADQGKTYTVGEPSMHIPLIERNASSTQTGGKRCRVSGTMVSGSTKSQKAAKIRHSGATVQVTESRVKGHVSGNNDVCTNDQSFPINNLKKDLSTGLKSIVFSMEADLVKNGVMDVGVSKKAGVAWPVKGSCRSEVCSVNRNPADFSIPGVGNKFMRRGGSKRRGPNIGMGIGKPSLTSHKRSGTMKQPLLAWVV